MLRHILSVLLAVFCVEVLLEPVTRAREVLPEDIHRIYVYDRKHDRVLFGGAIYANAQTDGPTDKRELGVLYEQDVVSDNTRTVMELPGLTILTYSPSSDGHHVAIRTSVDNGPDTMALHIVDRGGHELARISSVWEMTWSPDGNQLAYVTGPKVGDAENPRPSSVWIYDLRSRTSQKVYDGGRYLAWAEFDRALYVLDYDYVDLLPRVWRIDPVSQKPKLTSHRSVYFSPTGMYYYHSGINEGPFEVYDVQTNTPQFAPALLRTRFPSGTEPIGWVDSGGNQLLFLTWSHPVTGKLDERPHTMLFDLDRNVILEVATQGVIGTKAGTYITYRDKKFHKEHPKEVRHAPPVPR
jgi:WD40 repeat protein